MKLLVIDGNSIVNRAFYGIKLLTTKKGTPTNAIYGFLTILNKLTEDTKPNAVAIAFDLKAPTFRHKKYSEYKAKRKGMPEELFVQIPVLKKLLEYMGYNLIEREGFEADDILGTLAKASVESGNECIIATGDRDSLQLVSPQVCVKIATTKFGKPETIIYDENKVFETYGVIPPELIEIKAIQGDASDNIPGVAGIGEKGAKELIQKFHSIDYIYENLDNLDIKDGIKTKLKAGKDSAYMSRELGTIFTEVPISKNIPDYILRDVEKQKVADMLAELEMFSLMEKMGLNRGKGDDIAEQKKIKVTVNEDLVTLKKIVDEENILYFFAQQEQHEIQKIAIFAGDRVYVQDKNSKMDEFLKYIFENEKLKKCTYDVKSLIAALQKKNIKSKNINIDVMLAAYILNPSAKSYEPDRVSVEYGIAVPNVEYEDEEIRNIAVKCVTIKKIEPKLMEELKNRNQNELFEKIEMPLARVLADLETEGFFVDEKGLREYGNTLKKDLDVIEHQIYSYIGEEVNINSPKQLGVALFEKLNLKKGKKTKSGYSTSAEVLEKLRYDHPVIGLILQYRTIAKLKSTYCDGLVKAISPDGRIHSFFNQTETKTGRISSLEPNLQNIPVRSELGRTFRKFFIAKDGNVLVDADYSQIELRILAHIANDETMIDAFKNNIDIHGVTASQVFNMPMNMVTPIMRNRAKAVNFGIIYGISAFSLSKDIGVSRKEAEEYIRNYFAHYKKVENYMENIICFAKENGYVETLFNRRRYLPELASSNFNLRAFGERVARNMPIQGTAADIIKIAMINVENRLRQENLKSKLILQVHDELIVEAPENETEKVKSILTQEMENAVDLKVPLVAEAKVGKTWYEAKES